ncbi:hypothetical protein F4775DRAFT_594353 [Biscogniauxia sp. FL1348]|nr:hypothetical protein F4775DRAFT_594353 [Biscogniauxia sp. FL1348]
MDSGEEFPDYYAILKIEEPEKADDDLIKQRYKRVSLETHPDKNRDDQTATARFQLVQNARDTLLDPEKRRRYDIERKKNMSKTQTAGENDSDGGQRATAWPHTAGGNDSNEGQWIPSWIWTFMNLHTPDPTTFSAPVARMPCKPRPQHAEDFAKAAKEWRDGERAHREELGRMREGMRARQKEDNERSAREREDAKARQKENEKNAWKNQQQQAQGKMSRETPVASSSHSKSSRIFHNLPGSSCEHRGQWDMMREPLTCQCCSRFMTEFAYRCGDCSMVGCKRCMKAVRKGGSR